MIKHMMFNVASNPTLSVIVNILLIFALVITVLGFITTLIVMRNTKYARKELEAEAQKIKEEFNSIYSDIPQEEIPGIVLLDNLDALQEETLRLIRRAIFKLDMWTFIIVFLITLLA